MYAMAATQQEADTGMVLNTLFMLFVPVHGSHRAILLL